MHIFQFFALVGFTSVAMLVGAVVCHLVPRRVADAFCRAPGLDVVITYFTVLPLIYGPVVAGWRGLVAAILGQVIGLLIWEFIHEALHRDAMNGPRIVKVLNSRVGRLRNHSATWITASVTPVFWLVRVAEVCVYPLLTLIVRLPPYKHGDWVNVSRQKFTGLVGHDLIWCLYCDWMTGVWSLGSEMLRNVESFWCPIRFASGEKCENCAIDFPDINNGWVDATGTMADVAKKLEEMYPKDADHPWFGHPVRLTVRGKNPANMDQPI
jgi:hypothetical protein